MPSITVRGTAGQRVSDFAHRSRDGLLERGTVVELLLVAGHQEHAVVDARPVEDDGDIHFDAGKQRDVSLAGQNAEDVQRDFDRHEHREQRDHGQDRRTINDQQQDDDQNDRCHLGRVGTLLGGVPHVAADRGQSAEGEFQSAENLFPAVTRPGARADRSFVRSC